MTSIPVSTGSILVYTRVPVDPTYPPDLANSVHLAYSTDGTTYEPLNQNYGIVFATATIRPNNTINPKAVKKPYLFRTAGGSFGIVAIRTQTDGSLDEESKGSILLWTSDDLVHFHENGLIKLTEDAYVEEVTCEYDASAGHYRIDWTDDQGRAFSSVLSDLSRPENISTQPGKPISYPRAANVPEGAIAGNVLPIDAQLLDTLLANWKPIENVAVNVPEQVRAACADDVKAVTATAVYSDGSVAVKKVDWNIDSIDFTKPGTYRITGTVRQRVYPFPLAVGYADPVVLHWQGSYYFIATNDNNGNIGLFVRKGDTVADLFREGVQQHLILDRDESRGFIQTFWAPEFHVIDGKLYIFFAVSGNTWGPQSHVMKLKDGGEIIDPNSWEDPIRVIRADGKPLMERGITLDMTYFETNRASYVMWSYRIWNPEDSGSMLMIATVDRSKPWQLTSEPVLISRPLYGWENIQGTINNEGPYPIVTDRHVHIAYSGGSANGYSYAVGWLTGNKDDDLLDPKNWRKSNAPALSFYSVEGEYGPGHCSFFTDEDGNLMIAYHALKQFKGSPRSTGIRRVHFNRFGNPVLNMSVERDLNPALAQVATTVIVE